MPHGFIMLASICVYFTPYHVHVPPTYNKSICVEGSAAVFQLFIFLCFGGYLTECWGDDDAEDHHKSKRCDDVDGQIPC